MDPSRHEPSAVEGAAGYAAWDVESAPLNTNDLPVPEGGWLAELQETWPIKLRITGPEVAVFSGLTRQDANAVFAFATTGQRHAFEALGAAAAWQVDFTARDNQVVPGTLADLLITLTLSGYHDPELRSAVDRVPRTTTAATRFLSGQTTFPDAILYTTAALRLTASLRLVGSGGTFD